jgi:hypothetical protein
MSHLDHASGYSAPATRRALPVGWGLAIGAIAMALVAAVAAPDAPRRATLAEPAAQRIIEDWRGNSAGIVLPAE